MRNPILGVAVLVLATTTTVGVASAQPMPEFKLGFKALAEQIPDVVGEPLEDDHHAAVTGEGLQRTTKGLLVWRKADNRAAFTDGHWTWVSGPLGVQRRLNGERFKWEVPNAGPPPAGASLQAGSLLSDRLLVTWYGNPNTGLMGVLGQFSGEDLAARLRRQADAYAPYTDKEILPAYHLVAIVAQGGPGEDGLWRRRESREVIDSMLEQARANHFPLILDVQVGHSTVDAELEHLRPYLEQPDVHLAIDPEFDMWPGQAPGRQIGHTVAAEANYAIRFLERIVDEKGLPPKVLILHQFTVNMLPDKENIEDSPVVDLVLDMDGFGSQAVKLDSYRTVMQKPLEYAGIKLFYDQDPDLLTPEQVMRLSPVPSVVVYQ
mgnify:CR=1 FL=1